MYGNYNDSYLSSGQAMMAWVDSDFSQFGLSLFALAKVT